MVSAVKGREIPGWMSRIMCCGILIDHCVAATFADPRSLIGSSERSPNEHLVEKERPVRSEIGHSILRRQPALVSANPLLSTVICSPAFASLVARTDGQLRFVPGVLPDPSVMEAPSVTTDPEMSFP